MTTGNSHGVPEVIDPPLLKGLKYFFGCQIFKHFSPTVINYNELISEGAALVVYRQRAGLWYPSLCVRTWPKLSDFQGEKILSTPSFGGEVKPSVPCRSFMAWVRSLNVTCKSAFRQNYRRFLAHSSTFCLWVLSRGDTHGDACWRKLECLTQIAR